MCGLEQTEVRPIDDLVSVGINGKDQTGNSKFSKAVLGSRFSGCQTGEYILLTDRSIPDIVNSADVGVASSINDSS